MLEIQSFVKETFKEKQTVLGRKSQEETAGGVFLTHLVYE
ncbi:hypothetical protein H206_06246 [Candidatus Electrothrix aarhusensis]|uniref:Uncharacterized protein n=1 Tax=Candidatus Electrothrix aarhusensis TaxID=1859131 RepID=A0A3S3SQ53_9BACT|nr:hypothetical protein H206_06246 [Candidatus Electrothrix aarhusensis]